MVTHESQIWEKQKDSLWVDEDIPMNIPSYLPNTEKSRIDFRRMYSNIKEMDFQIGKILRELEEDGELENTIIFWYSDHGGPFPRQKRDLHDSGIRVPMVIRFPNKQFAGKKDKRIVSFIDFAATVMSLANIETPEYMQGKPFLGIFNRKLEVEYAFAAADRFGKNSDHIRAVTDGRYKYIKYYEPEKPMMLPVGYREQMGLTQEIHRLDKLGMLSNNQKTFTRKSKPTEELFDTKYDPNELYDKSNDEDFQEILFKFRKVLKNWIIESKDINLLDEIELVKKIWPTGEQPITKNPTFSLHKNLVKIDCETEGASIGYKYVEKGEDPGFDNWSIYNGEFPLDKNYDLYIISHKIGFKPSEKIKLSAK